MIDIVYDAMHNYLDAPGCVNSQIQMVDPPHQDHRILILMRYCFNQGLILDHLLDHFLEFLDPLEKTS